MFYPEEMTLTEILEWFSWNCPAISEEEIQMTYEEEPEVIWDWMKSIENEKERKLDVMFMDDEDWN